MIRKILQSLADHIIKKLETTESEEAFQFYYEFGLWINSVAINWFNVYLE